MARDFRRHHGFLKYSGSEHGYVYTPEPEVRTSQGLTPERQDTGLTPDEIRPEVGFVFSQSDFSGGMGQNYYHHDGADKTKYLESFGFDISEPGKLTHVHRTAAATMAGDMAATHVQSLAINSFSSPELWVVFGGVSSSALSLQKSTNGTTFTSDNPGGGSPVTVKTVATDHANVYACTDSKIHKRNSAGTWSDYVTGLSLFGYLYYGKFLGRLFYAAAGRGGGFHEISAAGALPAAIYTAPSGYAWSGIHEMGPYIYAAASNGNDDSAIFHFTTNDAGNATILSGYTNLPGVDITGIMSFGGKLFLTGRRYNTSTQKITMVFYIAVAGEGGFLTYELIAESDNGTAADDSDPVYTSPVIIGGKAMGVRKAHIFIPWLTARSVSTKHGGALYYNLATDSFSSHIEDSSFNGTLTAAVVFLNRLTLGSAAGIRYEDKTKYLAQATLVTSVSDFKTSGLKSHRKIQFKCKPLPSGASIKIYYTLSDPKENNWTLAGTYSTAGGEGTTFDISTSADSREFALKIESNATSDGSAAPTFLGFTVWADPSQADGEREWRFIRKIYLAREVQKKRGAQPILMRPRTERDWLEGLFLRNIELYEPDESWNVRVEGVESRQLSDPNYVHDEQDNEEWEVTLLLRGTKQ